jgi:hypothetical protein
MKKMVTGPMQITPYRPWSEERKAAARARHGVRKGLQGKPVHYAITRLKDEIRKYGQEPVDHSLHGKQTKIDAWAYAVDAELARMGVSIRNYTQFQLHEAIHGAMVRHGMYPETSPLAQSDS